MRLAPSSSASSSPPFTQESRQRPRRAAPFASSAAAKAAEAEADLHSCEHAPHPAPAPSSSATMAPDSSRPAAARRRRPRSGRASWVYAGLCLLLLVCSAAVLPRALASEGDQSAEYRTCVSSRFRDVCGPDGVDDGMTGRPSPEVHADSTWLPWVLRATGWTCKDDSEYHCTHKVTNDALRRVAALRASVRARVRAESADARTAPSAELRARERELLAKELAALPRVQKQMVQYYGKWVFVRVLGAQEPLSVLFSLLNLYVHGVALRTLRRGGAPVPDAFPLKGTYAAHACVALNAWVWSAVFHTRDKGWTERLDYFSAGAVMLSMLFFTLCRLLRLAPGTRAYILLLRALGVAFALHVAYLSLAPRFDYGYNMAANVAVGVLHLALWAAYSVRPAVFSGLDPRGDRFSSARAAMRATKPRSGSATPTRAGAGGASAASGGGEGDALLGADGSDVPPAPVSSPLSAQRVASRDSRRMLQALLACTAGATLLELLDFPPLWRAVDAHCLWHLATAPLTHYWYAWLVDDARACVASGYWIGDAGLGTSTGSGASGAVSRTSAARALLPPPVAAALDAALARVVRVLERAAARVAPLAQSRPAKLLHYERIDLAAVSHKLGEYAQRAGFPSARMHSASAAAAAAAGADADGQQAGTAAQSTGASKRAYSAADEGYAHRPASGSGHHKRGAGTDDDDEKAQVA